MDVVDVVDVCGLCLEQQIKKTAGCFLFCCCCDERLTTKSNWRGKRAVVLSGDLAPSWFQRKKEESSTVRGILQLTVLTWGKCHCELSQCGIIVVT